LAWTFFQKDLFALNQLIDDSNCFNQFGPRHNLEHLTLTHSFAFQMLLSFLSIGFACPRVSFPVSSLMV
jgi:hypothetical protein